MRGNAYRTWFEDMLDDVGRRNPVEGIPLRRMGDAKKDIGAPAGIAKPDFDGSIEDFVGARQELGLVQIPVECFMFQWLPPDER